ncbi:hypothetical protein [Pyrobaculum ferrireducens]|uniref:Uncharacterized protein n=1 Tax=Pyrobaculum ferrireducens TaxID=1104324 RepID=G7VEZ5_9CREN|nr:hypothetical protein [Pyrobaculum ferrireducens]AET34160.1 hypothetical protein P186_2784 [Pyrobaculum ferrireducens]
MGLVLGVVSFFHLFLFGFLREGILPASVVSYFVAYAAAFDRRWLSVWAVLLAAGFFIRGAAAAVLSIFLFYVMLLAVPILLARGVWSRLKSLFFFVAGLALSGFVIAAASPYWRSAVPHPFQYVDFGQAIPTPVDWPWYFLGYYIWERVHNMYRGLPKSWKYLLYR